MTDRKTDWREKHPSKRRPAIAGEYVAAGASVLTPELTLVKFTGIVYDTLTAILGKSEGKHSLHRTGVIKGHMPIEEGYSEKVVEQVRALKVLMDKLYCKEAFPDKHEILEVLVPLKDIEVVKIYDKDADTYAAPPPVLREGVEAPTVTIKPFQMLLNILETHPDVWNRLIEQQKTKARDNARY